MNIEDKPRVKFYSNGLLIIEANNDYSIKWYSFDLNRMVVDSILSMKPLTGTMKPLTGTMKGLTPN
jgi:hypothetical protein